MGVFQPHDVRSYYFGTASNGHIERINVSSAFYYVFGRDDLNPIAGREVNISAYLAALELSYDRDWVRFRTSYFFNSGDSDPNDDRATGFDAIFAATRTLLDRSSVTGAGRRFDSSASS